MYDDLKTYMADYWYADTLTERLISRCAYGATGWDQEWILIYDIQAFTRQDV